MLRNHLKQIGIKSFRDNNKFIDWSIKYFKKNRISTSLTNSLFYYLNKVDEGNEYFIKKKLYKVAASNYKLLLFFHSIKFEHIYNSGRSIVSDIKNASSVLDLGCNSGYLTSYYAGNYNNIVFTGIDNCKNAIVYARYNYAKYKNLKFINSFSQIYREKFDYIIDSQCLSDISDKNILEIIIRKSFFHLHEKGFLLSVGTLQNEKETTKFLNLMTSSGFFLCDVKPIVFNSFGIRQVLSKLLFAKNSNTYKFDINEYFYKIRSMIN